jgi:hypothetical protein
MFILAGGSRKFLRPSYEGNRAMQPSKFMRRKGAAEYLREKFGVGSPATLAKLATLGACAP